MCLVIPLMFIATFEDKYGKEQGLGMTDFQAYQALLRRKEDKEEGGEEEEIVEEGDKHEVSERCQEARNAIYGLDQVLESLFECTLCSTHTVNKMMIPCGHRICSRCFIQLRDDQCPFCHKKARDCVQFQLPSLPMTLQGTVVVREDQLPFDLQSKVKRKKPSLVYREDELEDRRKSSSSSSSSRMRVRSRSPEPYSSSRRVRSRSPESYSSSRSVRSRSPESYSSSRRVRSRSPQTSHHHSPRHQHEPFPPKKKVRKELSTQEILAKGLSTPR